MAGIETIMNWQTIRTAEQLQQAQAVCELNDWRDLIQTMRTRVSASVAAVNAENAKTGRPQYSLIEGLTLFLRDFMSKRDAELSTIAAAAIGIELGLEPTEQARAWARAMKAGAA